MGKSTLIDALVATGQLDQSLIVADLDKQIETEEASSINEIFENRGESVFRDIEARLLREFTGSSENFILSTGGGTPCFRRNMAFMKKHGLTIYLKLDPETIAKRIYEKGIQNRPLLKGAKAEEALTRRLQKKLLRREKFYNSADLVVDLTNLTVLDSTTSETKVRPSLSSICLTRRSFIRIISVIEEILRSRQASP